MARKERTTRNYPCIFCGDVGYDMRIYYEEDGVEEVVHYCHKTKASKGDLRIAGGIQYYCIASDKVLPVVGAFDLWKEYLSKQAWVEKQKRSRPEREAERSMKKEYYYTEQRNKEILLPGEVKTKGAKDQHLFHTFLSSLLVLEDKHERVLCEEWRQNHFPGLEKELLKRYPIRSFPPVDKARFANNEKFQNMTRRKLVEKLVERFGDLSGYPFMYQRCGEYWESRPETERWAFACGEGILFPCYDKDGYLYRFRIKNDYPDLKLKEGVHDAFCGNYGRFHHYYDKQGNHCWSFINAADDLEVNVYGPDSDHSLLLDEKGMPCLKGKIEGKYTNISSVYAKRLPNGTVVNVYNRGCRSGSPYSLYYSDTDKFTVVIGTEGEKKSMVASYIKKCPVVCVPGVSAYSVVFEKDETGSSLIDYLKTRGMKYFILCYDADKEENERVLSAEHSFVEELKKHDVTPLIGEWKGKFNKGIDDILLMGLDISVRRV